MTIMIMIMTQAPEAHASPNKPHISFYFLYFLYIIRLRFTVYGSATGRLLKRYSYQHMDLHNTSY